VYRQLPVFGECLVESREVSVEVRLIAGHKDHPLVCGPGALYIREH